MSRVVLAATLSANYGIYGPAYELMEAVPRNPGSEEYLDSEKYQLRHWDLERPDSLRHFIALLNRIRKDNPALHSDSSLRFYPTDNDQVICYGKQTPDRANQIIVAVNLDPWNVQSGMDRSGPGGPRPRTGCQGPDARPAHRRALSLAGRAQLRPARSGTGPGPCVPMRRRVHSEQDFDYFL